MIGLTSKVRVGYQHKRGPAAIAFYDCRNNNCTRTYWNGVQFPV